MKKAWQIARLELSLLFYSPIAWVLVSVLFIQVTLGFVPVMEYLQRAAVFGLESRFLTSAIYTSMQSGGLLWNILSSLYLYIPLVTMGLMSREVSSGTIRLLFSSPLDMVDIVWGKYLAMLVFNLVLTVVLSLFVLCGAFTIIHFDFGLVLSALMGIYLMLGAYAAIGLFLSSLTRYQVVAAMGTFIVFGILNYIGELGQGTDVLRDITHSLSMPDRVEKLISGLITTRDVLYFLLLIFMSLSLTVSKLTMARDGRVFWFRAGRYICIVGFGMLAAYFSSRPRVIGYYDATATKVNTLRKNTQEVLKGLGDGSVEVIEYVNFLEPGYAHANPYERLKDVARWEPYLRFKPDIDIKWVYYLDSFPGIFTPPESRGKTLRELAQTKARLFDIDTSSLLPAPAVGAITDLRREGGRVVMQLKYKGRSEFLRTFDDGGFWPEETEVAAALKRLVSRPEKIVFVTGGYERSIHKIGDRDYKMLTNLRNSRYALVNQGFDVDTLSLEGDSFPIPSGITGLVIADPKVAFSPMAFGKVRDYIRAGGNLLLAGEPGKREVTKDLMELMGVRMIDGVVVQRSRDFSFDLVRPWMTEMAGKMYSPLKEMAADGLGITMPGVTGLACDSGFGFTVIPVLSTDSLTSWNELGPVVLDSAALVFDGRHGDRAGSVPTMLALTRFVGGKEQRIVVSADADFLSNAELTRGNLRNANYFLGDGVFGWFAYGRFPIDASRPRSKDTRVELSLTGVNLIKVFYWGVIPGVMVLLGTVLLIRRKRK